MQLFFLLLVLLLYLLPLPSPSPHNNNKKEEKRKEYEKANQRTSHSGVCGTAYCSCGELSPVDMHQFFFFFLPITVALCDLAFVFFFFSALLLFKPFQSNDLKDVFSLAFNFFFFFLYACATSLGAFLTPLAFTCATVFSVFPFFFFALPSQETGYCTLAIVLFTRLHYLLPLYRHCFLFWSNHFTVNERGSLPTLFFFFFSCFIIRCRCYECSYSSPLALLSLTPT